MSFFTKRNESSAEKAITAQEVDTMSEEDLFYLGDIYTHIGLPSNLIVSYEGHLAERLYYCDQKRCISLIKQMIPGNLPRAVRWTLTLQQNNDAQLHDVWQLLESPLAEYLAGLEGMPVSDKLHVTILGDAFTALLIEISKPVEQYWRTKYTKYTSLTKKLEDVSNFLTVRKGWLDISHADSVMLLRQLGWQPADIMLTYVYSSVRNYVGELSPDCVITSVDDDHETAEKLMDNGNYKEYFSDTMHPSYYMAMAFHWIDYMYLYYGYKDNSFLEKKHKSKKIAAYCQSVCENCHNSDFEKNIFEGNLRHFGLLASREALSWDNAKFIKKQRQIFLRAFICHYQWQRNDLMDAITDCPHPELFTSLVWGNYQNDKLQAAFILNDDMTACDEDGSTYELQEDANIGLVSPAELTENQINYWTKKVKKTGIKPIIPQLRNKFRLSDIDLSIFSSAVTKHITICTRAGKWGMYMGYDKATHTCCHMIDPLHKIGAQIRFRRITDGPEYNSDDVQIYGVTFYKLGKMRFGDCVPKYAIVTLKELPPRFVYAAITAFRELAGIH